MKFTSGIIGLGNIGLIYDLSHKKDYLLTHTKAYLKHKHFQLLFGVDLDPKKRALFEKYTNLPAFSTVKDAREVFSNVDIVSICVPLKHRNDIFKNVTEFSPRVILLEKPLAGSTQEAKKIINICKKHNIKLCVNYLRRFEKNTLFLKKIIESRRFGNIVHVNVFYNGGFYNNATHFVDFLISLIGKSRGWQASKKRKTGDDYEIDFFLSYPTFKVYFKSIVSACPVGEIDLWFDKGRIIYGKFGLKIDYYKIKKDQVYKEFNEFSLYRTVKTELPYTMYHVINNIYGFLSRKEKIFSDEKSAFETLRICENIQKSI